MTLRRSVAVLLAAALAASLPTRAAGTAGCLRGVARAYALGLDEGERATMAAIVREAAARVTPMTNQDYTDQCWDVASTASFDFIASQSFAKLLKLSPKYLYYEKTRIELEDLIRKAVARGHFNQAKRGKLGDEAPVQTIFYEQGGLYPDAAATAALSGVVPEEAYPGFPRKDVRMFRDLNALAAEFADALAAGEEVPDTGAELDARVRAILNRYLKRPPDKFRFDGVDYTPKTFFGRAMPGWPAREDAPITELNYMPHGHNGETRETGLDGRIYVERTTTSHKQMMQVLGDSLKKALAPGGRGALVVQYKDVREEETHANGFIGFAVHGAVPPKDARAAWADPRALYHYVVAVDAMWGPDGELVRLLVKNSFGASVPGAPGTGLQWIEPDYLPFVTGTEVLEP